MKIRRKIRLFNLLSCLLVFSCTLANAEVVRQKDRVDDDLSRIVGGSQVPAGQRTFQVALLQSNGRIWCGGSIIADNWVLTAAHCVENGHGIANVLSGTRSLISGGQRHQIAQIISHPQFNGNVGAGSDVALIRINGTFAGGLERLKLATAAIVSASATPGTNGRVSGWGLTSGGGTASNQLLQINNTIISDSQCRQLAGNIDTATVICANNSNQSSCNGDSGGPFTVTNGGQTYSVGIVSFGPQTCRGYSAYSETAALRSWVGQHVNLGGGGGGGTTKAAIQSPQPGSTLSGTSTTFRFSQPSGANGFHLYVGTNGVGTRNIFAGSISGGQKIVSNLPTNGSKVYVRLWTLNSSWTFNDYTYTAATAGGGTTKAVIQSPQPGSTLGGSSVTFSFSRPSSATQFHLYVGTGAIAANNIFSGSISGGQVNLPTDGSRIYVRLWTYSGSWSFNDYTYTAASSGGGGGVQTGTYRLINAANNRCVEVSAGSTQNGASLIMWDCGTANKQKWQLGAKNGNFQLTSVRSGKAIDVPGGSTTAGTALVQWTSHDGANQQWTVTPSGGHYEIKSVSSNLCMGLLRLAQGEPVQQLVCDGRNARIWRLDRQ